MVVEGEVVDDGESPASPRKGHDVRRQEQKVGLLARKRDRQSHLGPHAPEGQHHEVDTQVRLRSRGEEAPTQLGRGGRQTRAHLASEGLRACDNCTGGGIDVHRDGPFSSLDSHSWSTLS